MDPLRRLLLDRPMELVWPAVIFGAVAIAGWLFRWVALRGLHRWSARSHSRPVIILTESLRGPLVIWPMILGLHTALQSSTLPVRFADWGSRALLILWILSLTLMFMRFAGNLVRYYGGQVPGALPVTTLSRNLTQLAVFILGMLFLLRTLKVDVTPILTALGVGGLAVALALQDTLSNLFSGFYVAVARQIGLGDYIKLNTGEAGYVTDIGWRSTTIRELSNNVILIPNSKLAQAIVTNYHMPEKRMAASLQVTVAADSDPDQVERALLDVAAQALGQLPGLLAEPAPSVSFDPGFTDSGLTFTLGFQVTEFSDQFNVRNELRKRLLRRFRADGILVPYPTRTVYIREQSGSSRPAAPPD